MARGPSRSRTCQPESPRCWTMPPRPLRREVSGGWSGDRDTRLTLLCLLREDCVLAGHSAWHPGICPKACVMRPARKAEPLWGSWKEKSVLGPGHAEVSRSPGLGAGGQRSGSNDAGGRARPEGHPQARCLGSSGTALGEPDVGPEGREDSRAHRSRRAPRLPPLGQDGRCVSASTAQNRPERGFWETAQRS